MEAIMVQNGGRLWPTTCNGERRRWSLPTTGAIHWAATDLWAYHHKVELDFSRPGKPTDNSFVESFNGSLRDECLNSSGFGGREK